MEMNQAQIDQIRRERGEQYAADAASLPLDEEVATLRRANIFARNLIIANVLPRVAEASDDSLRTLNTYTNQGSPQHFAVAQEQTRRRG